MAALNKKLAPSQAQLWHSSWLHAKKTASSDTSGEIQGLTMAGELANRKSC